jgi:myo-inositol-1(or 4)-monophosphatase
MRRFLEVAVEAAREAGSVLMAEFSRPQTISYKGDVDLVTEADRRSEAVVVARLRSHFPKHAIVGEEGTGHEHLSAAEEARYRWYVDPLDGTTNFAHGYPCFAVSVGLAEREAPGSPSLDELLVGVVFNPVNGELFTAARGEGAYLNNKPIRVSRVERLATSLLSTGFPAHKRTDNRNIQYYWRFTLSSHGVRRDGSAALDLCGVACGRFDGFWEFGLRPWDTAAGVLMVQEAGGQITDLSGRPYQLGGPELLASNKRIHEEMRALAADIAERASATPH